MDLNRMKKLAGLLRENVEGEEQEVNEAANQKTVDFLVQKVSEDSRFKKMDVLMSKFSSESFTKKIQITVTVPVQFLWDEGDQSSYYIREDAKPDIESSVEKSPTFKTAKKEIDTKIKQFIKDSEGLVKEIAKKHNTKIDQETLSAVWNTLFLA